MDSTDVTVWFKMGRLAMSLENFSLARHAFEMVVSFPFFIFISSLFQFERV